MDRNTARQSRHPRNRLVRRRAKKIANSGHSGLKNFSRRWIFPPAIWQVGRKFRYHDLHKNTSLQPPEHPTPLSEIMFREDSEVVWVALDKVISENSQAYTPEQHQFVRYLESGFDDLEAFYEVHQPTTHLQAHFINNKFPDYSLENLVATPWIPPLEPALGLGAPKLLLQYRTSI